MNFRRKRFRGDRPTSVVGHCVASSRSNLETSSYPAVVLRTNAVFANRTSGETRAVGRPAARRARVDDRLILIIILVVGFERMPRGPITSFKMSETVGSREIRLLSSSDVCHSRSSVVRSSTTILLANRGGSNVIVHRRAANVLYRWRPTTTQNLARGHVLTGSLKSCKNIFKKKKQKNHVNRKILRV